MNDPGSMDWREALRDVVAVAAEAWPALAPARVALLAALEEARRGGDSQGKRAAARGFNVAWNLLGHAIMEALLPPRAVEQKWGPTRDRAGKERLLIALIKSVSTSEWRSLSPLRIAPLVGFSASNVSDILRCSDEPVIRNAVALRKHEAARMRSD